MRFADFTIHNGIIVTRRAQDTDHLAPEAIEYCRAALRELRAAPPGARREVCDDPRLFVALGLPEGLDVNIDAHRFFMVAPGPDDPPFQFNFVLPDGAWGENDYLSTGTLNMLSRAVTQTPPTAENAEAVAEDLRSNRPVLATCLIPTPALRGEAVTVAADASTCFAAAMLLEEPA